jgi:hypothetical protein
MYLIKCPPILVDLYMRSLAVPYPVETAHNLRR